MLNKKTDFDRFSKPGIMQEWNNQKRWNPFNSYKLLTHVDTWKHILRSNRFIPAPILVTVDPTNVCNLNCKWCNAAYIRKENHRSISREMLLKIADYLPYWGYKGEPAPFGRPYEGVKAVCIAGGGEPLLNPHVGDFIDKLINNGIEVGVVTNGILINQFIKQLAKCTWVGVSVDAGLRNTYKEMKGSDQLNKVLDNISDLVDYSKSMKTTLGSNRPGYGVSYKFLLYENNVSEVSKAAGLAKAAGCKNIHYRPAGTPWNDLKSGSENQIKFNQFMIERFEREIVSAQELDGPEFGVYGVTHKFDSQFRKANHFEKCYAVFMTAVFEPPSKDIDGFTLGLCCDRRGDGSLELLKNCKNVHAITEMWGSKYHWQIHDEINVGMCPRCTYQPHNQIYENVILNDSMTHKFI